MQNHFRVDVRSQGATSVIALSGELDMASSSALEEELVRVADSGAEQLLIDLRGLEFMDSTGLSIIVKAHHQAEEAGRRFGLVKGTQQVQRLLSLTGVADKIPLVDTPEELTGGG